MSATVRTVADAGDVARAAADELVDAAACAVDERGRFTVALAGGSTPQRLYQLLADAMAPFRARLPWDRIHVFFGDEATSGTSRRTTQIATTAWRARRSSRTCRWRAFTFGEPSQRRPPS